MTPDAARISEERLAEVQSFHEDLRNLMASRHQLKEAFMADDVVQLCREIQQLRRERQSLEAQWQDIATAPKDGTVILLATAGLRASDAGCWNVDDPKYRWTIFDPTVSDGTNVNGYQEDAVTHWMPMPPASP